MATKQNGTNYDSLRISGFELANLSTLSSTVRSLTFNGKPSTPPSVGKRKFQNNKNGQIKKYSINYMR